MGKGKGIREVAYFDCGGGGQVVVVGNVAYVGNMRSPDGTTIVDVSDPAKPKEISRLGMVPGTHSHKVRVAKDLMVINREFIAPQLAPREFAGGLGIYDVSNPKQPKKIVDWVTPGKGCHRFDFDGDYVYTSATEDGYVGTIMKIIDVRNPSKPTEVGRWHMPGQWTAGGETPDWEGTAHRCHHPLRMGNRLYMSYWLGGVMILDIDDMSKPKLVSHIDWSPPFPWPTHTALPVPFPVRNRKLMIVADEDVGRSENEPPSFLWMVDITDEKHPVPFGSFNVEAEDGRDQPTFTGCHQPCEKITGTEIPVAWFAHGLRMVDFSNPHQPKETGYYEPTPQAGVPRIQSNDVTVDDRGLIYLLDRVRGLHILEKT
jgi:hypothetical protein